MDTPILLTIFNRPDSTKKVLEKIREARPTRLYVSADGPRPDRPDDKITCAAARALIDEIDWNCKVIKNYGATNLGCKLGPVSGINWFFSQVEAGIILEDDCVPSISFFNFAGELLKKYKNEERIMHISGNNFLFGKIKIEDDYYFSLIPNSWGWATWRRAWQKFDVSATDLPDFIREKKIEKIFSSRLAQKRFISFFKQALESKSIWDYLWAYAILKNGGLCINPRVNLVSNIGFAPDATHTTSRNSKFYKKFFNLPCGEITKIAKHPATLAVNKKADDLIMKQNFDINFTSEIKSYLGKIKKSIFS
jgi:hypothetical protein